MLIIYEDQLLYDKGKPESDRNNGARISYDSYEYKYSEAYSGGFDDPLFPSDDNVSQSCCDRVTYQVKNSARKRNPALTCTRSSRRISVAFLTCTCTIIIVSRPPSRVLQDSISRLLYQPLDGSESESMMDPFTGVSLEDGGEPLSPAPYDDQCRGQCLLVHKNPI
jgi:hypothetical protein